MLVFSYCCLEIYMTQACFVLYGVLFQINLYDLFVALSLHSLLQCPKPSAHPAIPLFPNHKLLTYSLLYLFTVSAISAYTYIVLAIKYN